MQIAMGRTGHQSSEESVEERKEKGTFEHVGGDKIWTYDVVGALWDEGAV